MIATLSIAIVGSGKFLFLDAFMLYFLTVHPKLFFGIHVIIWWFSFWVYVFSENLIS
jgi:hypothetical protein